MQLTVTGMAGTVESSDITVRIRPREEEGIELTLTSSVMQQYGKQIERVILETLASLGVTAAEVEAVDKGALDCTVRARVSAAVFRAAQRRDYTWEVKA